MYILDVLHPDSAWEGQNWDSNPEAQNYEADMLTTTALCGPTKVTIMLIIQISDTQQAWVIREFWKAAFWNLPPQKVVFFWECQSQSGDETGRIGGLIKQRDRKKWVVPIKLWVNRGAIPPSRAAICCWGHKHLQGGKCWGDNTALSFYFVISSPECTMDAVKRLLSMLSFQLKPPKRQTEQAVHYEVDSRKLVVQHL